MTEPQKSGLKSSERQRERDRRRYEDFKTRRAAVMVLLGNKCYLCDAAAGPGYHFHHREYHPVESNYPRHARSLHVRFLRLKEAEAHPERFVLLCNKDHKLVENATRRKSTGWIKKPAEFIEKLKSIMVIPAEKPVEPGTPF